MTGVLTANAEMGSVAAGTTWPKFGWTALEGPGMLLPVVGVIVGLVGGMTAGGWATAGTVAVVVAGVPAAVVRAAFPVVAGIRTPAGADEGLGGCLRGVTLTVPGSSSLSESLTPDGCLLRPESKYQSILK